MQKIYQWCIANAHLTIPQLQTGGSGVNYHAQDFNSNQSGDWFKMETELKQLRLNNPTATIKVEIVPEFTGTSKRPDRFIVDVEINGVPILVPYRIPNP